MVPQAQFVTMAEFLPHSSWWLLASPQRIWTNDSGLIIRYTGMPAGHFHPVPFPHLLFLFKSWHLLDQKT